MFITNSKKGAALWLSWVLLLGFVVAISAFMFTWTSGQNEKFAKDLRKMSDTAECDSTGLIIQNICQNPQVLYMNITNKNTIKIDQLVFNIFDVYLDAPLSRTVNVSLKPSEIESIEILKQSTTQQVEITPVILTDEDQIFCYSKAVTISDIKFCS